MDKKIFLDSDFYFYGEITIIDKDKKQIEIRTDEFGTLSIHTPKDFLEHYEKNLLYKTVGIHASGKEDMNTGVIEKSTLQFIELLTYNPVYDEKYLKNLQKQAKKHWADVDDVDEWLQELRNNTFL